MTTYNYGDFPTLEEIRRDYNELTEIIKNVSTLEQVKALDESKQFTIEINGMFVNEFINENLTDKDLDWIRYESYGCLSYIYNYIDGKIIFDVWSEYCYNEFIENITIDKLTEDLYEKEKERVLQYYGRY